MSGNFTVFQSAISALAANSQALSVTSNNIANVNTPGYSREEVVLATRPAQVIGGLELGLGVSVEKTQSVVDAFSELGLANATSAEAQTDKQSTNLQQVESVFNELGTNGLSSYINDFFNASQEVASDPSSVTARNDLLNKASIAVDRFHTLSNSLQNSQSLIDGDISDQVKQINSLASQIVDLNDQIQNAGGDALSLRDARTEKVQELSGLVDTKSVETSDGVFQVYIASGLQLVTGSSQATLSTQPDVSNNNHLKILFAVGSGASTDVTSHIQGGALKGLLTVRDQNIPAYQNNLNELAYELTTQVNAIHSSGYDLNGNTGNDFFKNLTNIASSTDLVTNLRTSSGTRLDVHSGDVINISGTLGAGFSTTLTVGDGTTLANVASSIQTALRSAAGSSGDEVAAVQADGSIKVTSGTNAITGLTVSIAGNDTFNTAFTFPGAIVAHHGIGSSTGVDVPNPDAASQIDLDDAVKDTPSAIAAAGSAGEVPGGNTAALALANLQTSNVSFSTGSSTISSFYGDLLAKIGSDSQNATNSAQFASDLLTQAQVQRESISGVSLEEEQLNLLKYQSAFQAAAKLVSIADDVFKSLVNLD